MIGRDDIIAAYDRVRPHIRRTPVIDIEAGALGSDAPVTLKLEQLQVTGSFKVRGAFNNMTAATLPDAGVVGISGGNHGAAVGYAATKLGVASTVFVPSTIADKVKIARMEGFGAKVVIADGTVDQAVEVYEDFARKTGAMAVHPYGSEGTLAGQGTVGLELEQQAGDLDTILVAVGGGGLIGGIAAWYAGRTKIVAVETTGTCCLDMTLRDTLPSDFHASGISASGLGASSIGELPLEIIKAYVAAKRRCFGR